MQEVHKSHFTGTEKITFKDLDNTVKYYATAYGLWHSFIKMFQLRRWNCEVYLAFANCTLTLLRKFILDMGTFCKSVVEMLIQGNKFYFSTLNYQWKQWKRKKQNRWRCCIPVHVYRFKNVESYSLFLVLQLLKFVDIGPKSFLSNNTFEKFALSVARLYVLQ